MFLIYFDTIGQSVLPPEDEISMVRVKRERLHPCLMPVSIANGLVLNRSRWMKVASVFVLMRYDSVQRHNNDNTVGWQSKCDMSLKRKVECVRKLGNWMCDHIQWHSVKAWDRPTGRLKIDFHFNVLQSLFHINFKKRARKQINNEIK